ncbi:MAG TPA: CPBP family glutamic-type intramembrane protease [Gemmatimonadaceae bacterium]|nr:CPBP family glutamic-type intramembrane protease [Gemmatimonadaceae bacterium]
MDPNSHDALQARRRSGALSWRDPALMLFARAAFGVAAQGLVAGIFAVRGSRAPWHAAEPWLPVYGTLIDAGCLALLWRFARREGIALVDLIGFRRARLVRDILLGVVLVPISLVFIFAGTSGAGWIVYGSVQAPYFLGGLPLPAALYGVLIWPFIWGLAEQMTYNGYLLPRFQVLAGRTGVAVAVVVFVWSLQHAFMPLTFDASFMEFRLLASVPSSIFETLLYLRLRRVLPLAVAHALMDGATVLMPMVRG